MKYYSDKTSKFYDTQELCEEAERKFDEEKVNSSKTKKELADRIEKLNTQLEDAYNQYKEAKAKGIKMVADATNKANDLLADAKKYIDEIQESKRNAISEFNLKFGAYRVTYTDEECKRIANLFDNLLNFWKF